MLDVQGTGTAAITANKVNGNIVLGNDSAKVNLTLTGADTSWAGNSSGGSTTDFTKGTHVNLNGGTWKTGRWWELGIGTNINLNENTHIYLDLQKTCNGKINTPWQWNASIRCSF